MGIRESRRLGRFSITEELLDDAEDNLLMEMMSNFIVVRAENIFADRTIEYTAWSPLFDELKRGVMTPYYTVTCEQEQIKNEDGSYSAGLKLVKVERQ